MRTPALPLLAALLIAPPAFAQATWQPATPPLVTADNMSWYQAGEPIIWNGDYYFPAGAAEGFNQYQMVRSGSYRGIPLYTDATLEPYSIVFVPLNGARMQPYERRRTGQLAGTTGSRAPSLPTDIAVEGIAPAVSQAVGAPDFARAYDVARTSDPVIGAVGAVGTSGRTEDAPPRPVTTVLAPTGLNAIWIEYDGARWYGNGQSIAYDARRLNEIGSYRGWTVYALKGDPEARTIFVPSIPGRLAPYTRK